MARLKRYVLVMFQSRSREHSIGRSTVLSIQNKLEQSITTPPEKTQIDLWLDSPGGDAHAAYKLVLDLRSRASLLRVAIPDYAKSAATLIALGMDEIFMAPGAELGPLDVQLSHPNRETEVISGLDVVGSLNYLSEFAVELAITGGADVLSYTGLSRKDVLGPMLDFVAKFLRPCVEQIDPHLTRRAKYQLEVGERYAVDLLNRRIVGRGMKLREGEAKLIAQHMVHHYPVHEFVIDRTKARDELKLPIKNLETYQDRRAICKLYESWSADPRQSIIQVIDTAKRGTRGSSKQAAAEPAAKKKGTKYGKHKAKLKGVA